MIQPSVFSFTTSVMKLMPLSFFYKLKLVLLATLVTAAGIRAQIPPGNAESTEEHGIYDTIRVSACRMDDGTLVPCSWLEPVLVTGKMSAYWRNYHKEWNRLRNAVYVTYPYARAAGKIMQEINVQLEGVTDRKERKRILHSREKDLKREFTSKLTKLSVYQGRVLMKLINRQTGNNCYEIVDEYKGHVSAVFWQSIAYVFGSSLRQEYAPRDKDRAMELIVQDVEKMYGYR